MQRKFNLKFVQDTFNKINNYLNELKQVPIEQFCMMLDQFCVLFSNMSSVLGMAFADISQKSTIIRGNMKTFIGINGFFQFVKFQMGKNIHILNGQNNSKKKAEKQFKNYNSTSRNLLRMMWFLSFLRSAFEQIQAKPLKTKLSDILDEAYTVAFGDKHSWIVRKGAQIAIATGSDRKRLVQCVLGVYDEEKLKLQNAIFLKELVPVHEALWKFYKDNNLTELE